jgi:hypothetical protein
VKEDLHITKDLPIINLDDILKTAPKSSRSKRLKKLSSLNAKELASPNKKLRVGELFLCPICLKRSFPKAQALGGHMSKSHPNSSSDYTRKQQRRKERRGDREILKMAKEVFHERFGEIPY